MKRLLIWAAPALMAGMVFVGCQKSIDANEGGRDVAMLATLTGGGDCTTDCIDENSGDIFAATGSVTETWGNQNNPNSKTLSVKVWNTLTTIEYRFTLTTNANNGGNLQYFDEDLDDWVNVGALTIGQEFSVSRPLTEGWAACDEVTEQWRQVGGGAPADLGDVTYSLIGECGCDEAFSYVENEDGTITFTYTPDADYTAANLVFTFAQSAVVSIDGFEAVGATMQATLDLVKCQTYTWTATIEELRCTGQGQTTVNAWTDFKVNEVSKKNDGTPNIIRPCN